MTGTFPETTSSLSPGTFSIHSERFQAAFEQQHLHTERVSEVHIHYKQQL